MSTRGGRWYGLAGTRTLTAPAPRTARRCRCPEVSSPGRTAGISFRPSIRRNRAGARFRAGCQGWQGLAEWQGYPHCVYSRAAPIMRASIGRGGGSHCLSRPLPTPGPWQPLAAKSSRPTNLQMVSRLPCLLSRADSQPFADSIDPNRPPAHVPATPAHKHTRGAVFHPPAVASYKVHCHKVTANRNPRKFSSKFRPQSPVIRLIVG